MSKKVELIIAAIILLLPVKAQAAIGSGDTYIKQEYINYAYEISAGYDISPSLIIAMIETESSGDPTVVSSHGALGLMQIIPKWHYERMKRLGVTDLREPSQNILVAVDFLHELFVKYDDIYDVLMYYNGGYPALRRSKSMDFSYYATSIAERAEELDRLRDKYGGTLYVDHWNVTKKTYDLMQRYCRNGGNVVIR